MHSKLTTWTGNSFDDVHVWYLRRMRINCKEESPRGNRHCAVPPSGSSTFQHNNLTPFLQTLFPLLLLTTLPPSKHAPLYPSRKHDIQTDRKPTAPPCPHLTKLFP
jgi:hypothetical protein